MAYFIDILTKDEKAKDGYIRARWKNFKFSSKESAIEEAQKALKDTKNVILIEVFQEGIAKPVFTLD